MEVRDIADVVLYKESFVNSALMPMLKALDSDIESCKYSMKARYENSVFMISAEYIELSWNGGGHRAVDITGDSELLIVKDVLNVL